MSIALTMPAGGINGDQLLAELQAAGVPATTVSVSGTPPNQFVVIGGVDNTYLAQCQTVLANHHPAQPRAPRLIRDIYADLLNLTTQQQTNVKNDLLSGTPPKWQLSNRDAIWASTPAIIAATGAIQARALAVAVAYYVLDNPNYLVHPAFDNTINIPGDQPAS